MNDVLLDTNRTTIGKVFKENGYQTGYLGKWHVDGKPLQNGFEHSYSLDDHDRYFAPRQHTLDDKPLTDYPLIALDEVEQAGFLGRTWDTLQLWFKR